MTICLRLCLLLLCICSSCQKQDDYRDNHLHLNFQEGDVPSLHPHLLINHMRGRSVGKLLFEGLVRLDMQGNPCCAGAKEVHISPDGMRYVFILREQHWSDGSKVTAEQYVAAWRHALTPGTGCLRPDLFYLIKNGQKAKSKEVAVEAIGVTALNESTLEVILEYPSAHFLQLIAHSLFAPLKSPAEEPEVFNGPFKLKKWEKGISLQLEPNKYFWNAHDVHLKQIDIVYVDDPMTAMYMFEKGQIDWIGDTPSPVTREIAMNLIEAKQGNCRPVDRFYWVHLNTKHPLLRSVKVRKALSLSLERSEITQHICIGEPLITSMHDRMIAFPEEKEDVEEAKKLFYEGLLELGYTDETCPTITLSYARQKPLIEYLKNRWQETLGVTIQLQRTEWNIFRSNLEHGDFEIGGCLEGVVYGDPLELLERFEALGNYNFSQWENETFKNILILIKNETNERKRKQLLAEAKRILVEQIPIIPIYRCVYVYAHHPKLKNYRIDGGGCIDFAYAHF